MDRRLRFLKAQIEASTIRLRIPPVEYQAIPAPSASEIDQLEEKTVHWEQRITQLLQSQETLQRRFSELIELRHVLRETAQFFDRTSGQQVRNSIEVTDSAPLLENDVEQANSAVGQYSAMHISYVTGVIPRQRIFAFERILWRTLRGNLYMSTVEIEDGIIEPSSQEPIEKNVFLIFAHGREIINKIKKISESLGASLYSVDEDPSIRRDQFHEVNSRIEDLTAVLSNTSNTLHAELRVIVEDITYNSIIVAKEKAIYHTLNLLNYDQNRKTLIAEGWVPRNSMADIQRILSSTSASMPSIMSELRTTKVPPTYHRTNKFTASFQGIIDAYGIATYREVNPAVMSIVTFPFLFAVMFGDLGHGAIMFGVAVAMILNERRLSKINDELFDMVFGGRYILLMMGFFSMYTGIVYNDLFSKAMALFGSSRWQWPADAQPGQIVVATSTGVYPIGIDPGWHGADNDLLFINSYKMKLSIVLGVMHMTYSLWLSFANHRFFGDTLEIYANFIPQMLFLMSIFGYLVLLIIYKWSQDWIGAGVTPPGLLNTLIFMFLSPGTIQEPVYRGQSVVQIILVLLALICVPWMLLTKPLVLRYENNKAISQGYEGIASRARAESVTRISHETEGDDIVIAEGAQEEEHFEFGEVMIHQVIHTIEFCLGCISHTASYLRLWALSLAHNQLSVVLWSMTIGNAFGSTGVIGVLMTVFTFGMWFTLSVVVLVVMEG